MSVWDEIPADVVDWFRSVFAEANRRVTERLINVPNIRETSLDDGLVEAIIPFSPPRILPSSAVVGMQIHNIGGLRRYGRWETADIAVLVFVYRANMLIAQKIGFLQSKRLFPLNHDVDEDDAVTFDYGLNRYLNLDPHSPLGKINRKFEFARRSKYASLKSGDKQLAAIDKLNKEFGESVFYLFYNPPQIPSKTQYPVATYQSVAFPPLGCRVATAAEINATLSRLPKGLSPTFSRVTEAAKSSNWRLEEWAADLLLRCKVGQEFGLDRADVIGNLIERRSGPIGAVVATSVALPGGD